MAEKTLNQTKIVRGQTLMVVDTSEGEDSFVYPVIGPEDYRSVGAQILKSGLMIPTGLQVSKHLRECYASNNQEIVKSPEAGIMRDTMKNGWLWVFNRRGWTPRKAENAGVYVAHDSKAIGLSEKLNIEQLEDLLSGGTLERGVRFSKDRNVRFAPESTFVNINAHDDLAQHGMVIADYDVKGAENLAEVSKVIGRKPVVRTYNNNSDKFVDSVAVLGSYWYFDGGLVVGGGSAFSGGYGCAFGVLGSARSDTKN